MNWPNAKNLALLFLAILNIFLGVLVYVNRTEYRLSPEAEDAVLKLLSGNNIKLASVMPKEYTPMSQLLMSPCPPDIYLSIFFPLQQEPTITLEYDKTIYKTDTAVLVLQNGGAVFTSVGNTDEPQSLIDMQTAEAICNDFLAAGQVRNFVLDRLTQTSNGYRLEYRENHKGLIFSNYFIFEVTANGITSVRSKYDQYTGGENGRREIISTDRALFILMKYLVGEYENADITIDSIDIVYIQPETSVNADASLRAAPYYRFYYSQNDLPILVNAYTGAIFDYIY